MGPDTLALGLVARPGESKAQLAGRTRVEAYRRLPIGTRYQLRASVGRDDAVAYVAQPEWQEQDVETFLRGIIGYDHTVGAEVLERGIVGPGLHSRSIWDTQDTPSAATTYCPGCYPDRDPQEEILDVRYCEVHTPATAGLDDESVTTTSYPSGAAEAGGEDNRRWCALFHGSRR